MYFWYETRKSTALRIRFNRRLRTNIIVISWTNWDKSSTHKWLNKKPCGGIRSVQWRILYRMSCYEISPGVVWKTNVKQSWFGGKQDSWWSYDTRMDIGNVEHFSVTMLLINKTELLTQKTQQSNTVLTFNNILCWIVLAYSIVCMLAVYNTFCTILFI